MATERCKVTADTRFDPAGPWPAPAKLNLFLHVTGRRADGYHELQTLFQFLDYGDELWFDTNNSGEIRRISGNEAIDPEQDLVIRAAHRLAEVGRSTPGVSIRIHKRLPMGGGLGGGSSDAATTLVVLNRLWSLGLDHKQLMVIGLSLGADVPVFIAGQAAWAEGVGEVLTPVEMLAEGWFVVICPAVTVSTPVIFTDPQLTRNSPQITIADFLSGRCQNQLQPVVERLYPEVAEATGWLSRFQPAQMTGSGACVFAAFASFAEAQSVLQQLPSAWNGFVARGCNRSPLYRRFDQLA